ncbi:MAG: M36 family metallopeptidase, partial [Rhodothermia bacterium]|nr:M36 family metallopeptidase [Rhodothermia bacterium]
AGDLELVSVRSTRSSHHVLFQQHVAGLPVYRRFLKVNLDADLQPTMSVNGVVPSLESQDIPRATVSSSLAMDVVRGLVVKGDVRMSEPDLMLYPADSPFPVWRIVAWPTAMPGEWEVLVDATTTKVIQILDRASHRIQLKPDADLSDQMVPAPVSYEVVARVDGSGLAFDPDPLTSSGSPYSPPYTDSGDAPTPELEAERILVDLPGISLDNEGLYRLDGPYVRIVGGGSISFEPPGETSPDGFTYSRSEPGFEAVGAYYHLDKSQRYVQSLGFTDLQNAPIRVNPRASAVDNSFYTPGQNFLEFGTGGVDDAEDAGVMWHEYAHALLEAGSPGLSVDGEGQAFHEGWSDYWAGSYMRFLAESETGKRTDWENVFRWDSGDGQIWPGRSLTRSGVYPDNTTCEDPNDANGDGCVIHSDGLLWATTLMEIYTDVGKAVMDRLALQSHAYLAPPFTFVDAAEAIVQADRDLYGGTHTSAIIQRLSDRGYLDASSFGPIVSHQPLRSTEDLGQSVNVVAQVAASSANVQSVVVRHRVRGETAFDTLVLTNTEADEYTGDLDLPLLPSTVEYYVEAVDENEIQSRLPANAPAKVFEFDVGPDTEAPTISHIPISSASNALWPVPVVTTVDDNLGVDSVWVDFAIEDKDGLTYQSGSFGLILIGNEYRAAFPVAVAELRVGSMVRYRITAQDAAVAQNTTDAPSSGMYNFPIVFSGVLASFDFEFGDGDLEGTGAWQRGAPVSVLQVAHSGTGLWGTNLTGPYPDFAQQSSLTLPEFNLAGLASAYLVFWYWYDFEYRGTAGPGEPLDGSIWDGGNIKVSTDGGTSWSIVEPDGGYSGVIAASATNPLSGEPSFGGYSFGWRREVVALPTVNGLEIRFDLGTDESNLEQTIGFAGWYIDDLALVTER